MFCLTRLHFFFCTTELLALCIPHNLLKNRFFFARFPLVFFLFCAICVVQALCVRGCWGCQSVLQAQQLRAALGDSATPGSGSCNLTHPTAHGAHSVSWREIWGEVLLLVWFWTRILVQLEILPWSWQQPQCLAGSPHYQSWHLPEFQLAQLELPAATARCWGWLIVPAQWDAVCFISRAPRCWCNTDVKAQPISGIALLMQCSPSL